MEDPTRVCEVLVGLGDVEVLGVDDEPAAPLGVRIRTRRRPPCGGRGGAVWSKGTGPARLVDLPAFGRPVRLIWHKWRRRCPAAACAVGSFTETDERIAPALGAHGAGGPLGDHPGPTRRPSRRRRGRRVGL